MPGMFTNPDAYERYMGRWSARVAPSFADFAEVRDEGRILDVGCGTGALIGELKARTRRAEIVGIDTAQSFLNYARSRFPDPRITLDPGNAVALPYDDHAFDQALSLLVFQLLPQGRAAASEMRRVTRPGGRVAACAWDDRGLELAAVLWKEARRFDPEGVEKAAKDRPCSGRGQLAELWRAAGLRDVEEASLEIRTEFTSFDDYWLPLLGGVGPAGSYVVDLDPKVRQALREALRARLLGGGPDRPFALTARAWAVRGSVPEGARP